MELNLTPHRHHVYLKVTQDLCPVGVIEHVSQCTCSPAKNIRSVPAGLFIGFVLFVKMAKLFLPDGRIVTVVPRREHFTIAEVAELAAKWCHLIPVPPHGCLYANVDSVNLPRNENVVAELHLDGVKIYGPALLLTPAEWKELQF
jgi:hypothetical protein